MNLLTGASLLALAKSIYYFHCHLVNWIGRMAFWRANFSRFAVHETQLHFFVSVFTSLFSLRFCFALPAWACCIYTFCCISKLKLKLKLTSVCYTQSAVRGPQSTFYTDRYVM